MFYCYADQLVRVLADLPVEVRMLIRIEPTFKGQCVTGSIMEARGNAQSSEPVIVGKCCSNAISFSFHALFGLMVMIDGI
jgi:hypothetical protein